MSSTVFFALDVRADYSRTEQDNITKYKLGKQVIYNSAAAKKHLDRYDSGNDGSVAGYAKGFVSLAMAKMNLNITIDSLGNGQHIECRDLEELLEAEDTVMTACRNVKQFLAAASTFDGRTILIDYDGEGEMTAHQSRGMPELSRHAPSLPAPSPLPVLAAPEPSLLPAQPTTLPEAQPVTHSAPMRPSMADQPVGRSPEFSFTPLLDRLDDEDKSMLLKWGGALVGAAILLYVLIR